jgi:hypothetical protein
MQPQIQDTSDKAADKDEAKEANDGPYNCLHIYTSLRVCYSLHR